MHQNSVELAGLGQKPGIQQNNPSWNMRSRHMGPQRSAKFHADGTAGKRRQRHYRFGSLFGNTPGNPAGGAAAGALKKS